VIWQETGEGDVTDVLWPNDERGELAFRRLVGHHARLQIASTLPTVVDGIDREAWT